MNNFKGNLKTSMYLNVCNMALYGARNFTLKKILKKLFVPLVTYKFV